MHVFLYDNPVSPAVVGLVIFSILGWYAQTRAEIRRGELPEGPPAAHPFALLVQSLLVLLRDKWLLGLMLAVHGLAAARWAGVFFSDALHSRPVSWFWPPEPWDLVGRLRDFATGANGLDSLRYGLCGTSALLEHILYGSNGSDLAALLVAVLAVTCLRRPPWLTGPRVWRAALVCVLGLAGAAGARLPGHADLSWRLAGDWTGYAAGAGTVAAQVLVRLCVMAAVFELVLSGTWRTGVTVRRVISAYVPLLIFVLLQDVILQLGISVDEKTSALAPARWLWPVSTVFNWLPVLLFPLPWALLERERGLVAGLQKTGRFLWRNRALALVFAMRLMALVAPLAFGLGLADRAFDDAYLAQCAARFLLDVLALVSVMTVCRAYVSIEGREALWKAGAAAGGVE